MQIFKAIRDGLYYDKRVYRFTNQYGSLFFSMQDIQQHLQYANKWQKTNMTGAVIIEYELVERQVHQIEFPSEPTSGETFEEVQ